MTKEPTMATPEEAAQNERIQAEVAELVKRYVSGSRSERLQVWTLALVLIQKKKKTKKGKNYKKTNMARNDLRARGGLGGAKQSHQLGVGVARSTTPAASIYICVCVCMYVVSFRNGRFPAAPVLLLES